MHHELTASVGPHDEGIACPEDSWEDVTMAPEVMDALLKLPEGERVDLAMALWASLEDSSREAAFELTPAQSAELDRRMQEHLADPTTAVPWEEVRKRIEAPASDDNFSPPSTRLSRV